MLKMFFNHLMAQMNLNKRGIYDVKPFPIGKASMMTVFFLIIFLAIGSLLISGFFSTSKSNFAPIGNEDTRARP